MTRRQPPGLAILALTEAWERFSFYGMQALLVLYMATSLLPQQPERRVLGFAGFRHTIEAVTGPLSPQAFASQVFGLYAGLVYLTPLLGGLLGDRLLGGRVTVLLGAALMAAGHFLLAFDASFLIALGLLVLGSGCLKGNIATQVGRLYDAGDARRDRAYLLFNLGINIGAFAGPLACGAIGEARGAHWGFASAGIGMLIGILVYVAGWRHLSGAARRPSRSDGLGGAGGKDTGDGRRVLGVIGLVALSAFYNLPFGQTYNVLPLWIASATDRHVGAGVVPITWYLACDGLVTVLATPIVLILWKRQAAMRREPGVAAKFAIGCALMAAADALLAALSAARSGAVLVGPFWTFGYFLLASSAYLFVMPVLLAAVSRAAPRRLTATLMGVAYAGLFVANVAAGWIARFYEPLGPARFWAMQAAIAAAGVATAISVRKPLGRALLPQQPEPETTASPTE